VKYHSVTDVLQQVGKFVDDSGIKEETENGIKAALQSTLTKMDMVNRDEFDAQTAVLQRTRQRVEQLEQQLVSLGAQLEALKNKT